jgi:hypothetical protein
MSGSQMLPCAKNPQSSDVASSAKTGCKINRIVANAKKAIVQSLKKLHFLILTIQLLKVLDFSRQSWKTISGAMTRAGCVLLLIHNKYCKA